MRVDKQGRIHTRVHSMYENHFCPHCNGFENVLKNDFNTDPELEAIIQAIYDGTFDGNIDIAMVEKIAGYMRDAMMEGYGLSFADLEAGTVDMEMVANLEKNIYQFACAKNYQQLKTMTLALKDADGNLVSFADFKKVAADINGQYNKVWLETEYDTAIGSAQMASNWTRFAQDAYLEYTTAGDDRVRDSHAALDGVIKLKTDKFWNTYYPPNGWRCRCHVIESVKDVETPDDTITYPGMPDMFRVNTAKEGLLFPPKHPYYDGCPKSVKKQAVELYKQNGKTNG